MKYLKDILPNVPEHLSEMPVAGITSDSRQVKNGYVFVAVKGTVSDGHDFIAKAIESGAVAIIGETIIDERNYIRVNDSAETLGLISHSFYDEPTYRLQLIGITGTNGKTSTATLCFDAVRALGFKAGLISTIENRINDEKITSTHTTPDPVQLNALLEKMADAGCEYVFMEVSSHAAHQKRIAGLRFAGAVFTNITHDHLDYHKTFDEYIRAKKLFFDGLDKNAFALVNADDKRSDFMLQNCIAKKYKYAVKGDANFVARIKENLISGLVLKLDGAEFHSMLPGEFNAWNLLCVYSILRLLDFTKEEVLTVLSNMKPVEGRFDVVYSGVDQLTGIVDYAHTPDAIEKLLSTVRSMLKNNQQLIAVVGCGGDRDKTKRPLMAHVAATLSDKVILTSDNPRTEEPEMILSEMEAGLKSDEIAKSISVVNRKEAIKTAVMLAQKKDVICVAGKGHEKYQEIKGVKYPFDDKQILIETFKTLGR